MKNQILAEYWDGDTGKCTLHIANKWGKFSAETVCSEKDRDIISYWTGVHLCQYKILIKTLKAKAKAFDQRATGIRHSINVLKNIDSQAKWITNKTPGDTYLNLYSIAETTEKEAYRIRQKIKELEENYPSYAEHLLNSKRQIVAKAEK